ncbi:TRAP transporter small permease [Caproiciproducens sp. NJN-50]|uniref:TRAP transporter small permease n=1 Tax=Acutalibacteraceae TaxID=3082771 RepID=UPI000FFE0383|nr:MULTISPECIES: TRAP transporter small permease [Acutalibacteraceae]QAT50728.1 TRAP transporter small permease [Caproiciproducens sp. NJN-50]
MKKIFKSLNANFERVCMIVLFIAMFCVVLAGISSRLAGSPFGWTEEASRLTFVWMIFFGLSYGTMYDKHIRVTVLVDKFGPTFSAGVTIFWDIVTALVFIWIAVYGCKYVGYSANARTFAMDLNKGTIAFIIPFSACLNVFRTFQKLILEHIPTLKAAKQTSH